MAQRSHCTGLATWYGVSILPTTLVHQQSNIELTGGSYASFCLFEV